MTSKLKNTPSAQSYLAVHQIGQRRFSLALSIGRVSQLLDSNSSDHCQTAECTRSQRSGARSQRSLIAESIPWFDEHTRIKCSSRIRCHHLLKTFWTGTAGWADRQLPDGPVIWKSPTGKTLQNPSPAAGSSSPRATPPPCRDCHLWCRNATAPS